MIFLYILLFVILWLSVGFAIASIGIRVKDGSHRIFPHAVNDGSDFIFFTVFGPLSAIFLIIIVSTRMYRNSNYIKNLANNYVKWIKK